MVNEHDPSHDWPVSSSSSRTRSGEEYQHPGFPSTTDDFSLRNNSTEFPGHPSRGNSAVAGFSQDYNFSIGRPLGQLHETTPRTIPGFNTHRVFGRSRSSAGCSRAQSRRSLTPDELSDKMQGTNLRSKPSAASIEVHRYSGVSLLSLSSADPYATTEYEVLLRRPIVGPNGTRSTETWRFPDLTLTTLQQLLESTGLAGHFVACPDGTSMGQHQAGPPSGRGQASRSSNGGMKGFNTNQGRDSDGPCQSPESETTDSPPDTNTGGFQKFACLFAKYDRMHYDHIAGRNPCINGFPDFRRVKEHTRRVHSIESHCPHCKLPWSNPAAFGQEFEAHKAVCPELETCGGANLAHASNESQVRALDKDFRGNRTTAEAKWYCLYRRFFPEILEQDLPPSPYNDFAYEYSGVIHSTTTGAASGNDARACEWHVYNRTARPRATPSTDSTLRQSYSYHHPLNMAAASSLQSPTGQSNTIANYTIAPFPTDHQPMQFRQYTAPVSHSWNPGLEPNERTKDQRALKFESLNDTSKFDPVSPLLGFEANTDTIACLDSTMSWMDYQGPRPLLDVNFAQASQCQEGCGVVMAPNKGMPDQFLEPSFPAFRKQQEHTTDSLGTSSGSSQPPSSLNTHYSGSLPDMWDSRPVAIRTTLPNGDTEIFPDKGIGAEESFLGFIGNQRQQGFFQTPSQDGKAFWHGWDPSQTVIQDKEPEEFAEWLDYGQCEGEDMDFEGYESEEDVTHH